MQSELKAQLKDSGYCVVPKLIPTSCAHEILAESKEVFTNLFRKNEIAESTFERSLSLLFSKNPEAVKNGGKQVQNLISLHQLQVNDELVNAIRDIAGLVKPVINTKPVLFFHNKSLAESEIYWKVPAHQDYGTTQGSVNSVVVWTPLVNMTDELGPLEVVPGSHKQGLRETKYDNGFGLVDVHENEAFKPILCDVGDVILFSTLLVHRSGTNKSDSKIRWSINLRFSDLADQYWLDHDYFCPYQYKSVVQVPLSPSKENLARYFGEQDHG